MSMHLTVRTVSFSAAALLSASALAQDNAANPEHLSAPERQNPSAAPMVQADLNYTYDASSATRFQGARLANSDASALNLGADTRFRINDDWFIPVGLQSENYFLGNAAGAPVPEDIHTLHLRTGLGWRMNDEWTFTLLAGPTLYRFEEVQSDDFGGSGAFLANYRPSADYLWTFGILVSPDNDVPALPIVGLDWRINDQYTLQVGVPKTRLTYHLNQQWSLFTGLDLNGTVFRSSENLGTRTGLPRYNNALATYRDIRLGVGIGYEVVHGLRAEVEAGYSVYRDIDYKDIGQDVKFDPAPYVRAGITYRF